MIAPAVPDRETWLLARALTRLARSVRLQPRSRSAERESAPDKVGGARRDRTDDLLLAKQALSQLSYGPAGRERQPDNGGPG